MLKSQISGHVSNPGSDNSYLRQVFCLLQQILFLPVSLLFAAPKQTLKSVLGCSRQCTSDEPTSMSQICVCKVAEAFKPLFVCVNRNANMKIHVTLGFALVLN